MSRGRGRRAGRCLGHATRQCTQGHGGHGLTTKLRRWTWRLSPHRRRCAYVSGGSGASGVSDGSGASRFPVGGLPGGQRPSRREGRAPHTRQRAAFGRPVLNRRTVQGPRPGHGRHGTAPVRRLGRRLGRRRYGCHGCCEAGRSLRRRRRRVRNTVRGPRRRRRGDALYGSPPGGVRRCFRRSGPALGGAGRSDGTTIARRSGRRGGRTLHGRRRRGTSRRLARLERCADQRPPPTCTCRWRGTPLDAAYGSRGCTLRLGRRPRGHISCTAHRSRRHVRHTAHRPRGRAFGTARPYRGHVGPRRPLRHRTVIRRSGACRPTDGFVARGRGHRHSGHRGSGVSLGRHSGACRLPPRCGGFRTGGPGQPLRLDGPNGRPKWSPKSQSWNRRCRRTLHRGTIFRTLRPALLRALPDGERSGRGRRRSPGCRAGPGFGRRRGYGRGPGHLYRGGRLHRRGRGHRPGRRHGPGRRHRRRPRRRRRHRPRHSPRPARRPGSARRLSRLRSPRSLRSPGRGRRRRCRNGPGRRSGTGH